MGNAILRGYPMIGPMEIHTPHEILRSLKDFVVHILTVTIGILIALSPDEIREGVREWRLVREARENFRADIEFDRKHLAPERANLKEVQASIQAALKSFEGEESWRALPSLKEIKPAHYVFRCTSWEAALSTGALAHMKTAEVTRYATCMTGSGMRRHRPMP